MKLYTCAKCEGQCKALVKDCDIFYHSCPYCASRTPDWRERDAVIWGDLE